MTTNSKKDAVPSEVRLVVEVDGNAVGFVNLDIERLWPLVDGHQQDDGVPAGGMSSELAAEGDAVLAWQPDVDDCQVEDPGLDPGRDGRPSRLSISVCPHIVVSVAHRG